MVEWKQNGKVVSKKIPPKCIFGFVYLIEYTNGKKYIGKKQIWSVTKKPFGKKKLEAITDNRAKKYEMVVKESKWRAYIGSSKETKDLTIKSKEILELCKDKLNLTYCEVKWMLKLDVLIDENFINSNIMGKFFRPKIHKGL